MVSNNNITITNPGQGYNGDKNMFKVGDKVRFKAMERILSFVGILIITSISDDGRFLRFNNKENGTLATTFELVEEEKPEIDWFEINKSFSQSKG
jgi:hypothetical protein